jgi:hypothetical protein
VKGLEVREDVLKQKCADGNNSRERVQLTPDKGVALTGPERLDAAADWRLGRGSGAMLGSGHEEISS